MSRRLNRALLEFNIGIQTAVSCLERRPDLGVIRADKNFKLNEAQYQYLRLVFAPTEEERKYILEGPKLKILNELFHGKDDEKRENSKYPKEQEKINVWVMSTVIRHEEKTGRWYNDDVSGKLYRNHEMYFDNEILLSSPKDYQIWETVISKLYPKTEEYYLRNSEPTNSRNTFYDKYLSSRICELLNQINSYRNCFIIPKDENSIKKISRHNRYSIKKKLKPNVKDIKDQMSYHTVLMLEEIQNKIPCILKLHKTIKDLDNEVEKLNHKIQEINRTKEELNKEISAFNNEDNKNALIVFISNIYYSYYLRNELEIDLPLPQINLSEYGTDIICFSNFEFYSVQSIIARIYPLDLAFISGNLNFLVSLIKNGAKNITDEVCRLNMYGYKDIESGKLALLHYLKYRIGSKDLYDKCEKNFEVKHEDISKIVEFVRIQQLKDLYE